MSLRTVFPLRKRQSPPRRDKAKTRAWRLSELEKRLMLAGDAGCAVSTTTAGIGASEMVEASSTNATDGVGQQAEVSSIVFVDPSVENADELLRGLSGRHEWILLDSNQGLSQITQAVKGHHNVDQVHIVAHGQSGSIQIGNQVVDRSALEAMKTEVAEWSQSLADGADILLYGCDTAAGAQGLEFIERLAELTGSDVAASDDVTGSPLVGADWVLERHVGIIDSALAFNDRTLRSYRSTLPITIRAAGSENNEQMLLQIDGETVATYNNVGGNSSNRQFETFTYDVDGISADQVRIVFTNSIYDPAAGLDNNLLVDSITIDGTTFETEDPSVFSTGTWRSEDGIVPGFREKEMLHTNGYFQYTEGNDPPVDGAYAIINEIYYNPEDAIDGDAEFLELFNPGDEDYDLSGMSFTGFDLTFAEETTLAAGQYAIVSPSIPIAEDVFGVTPIAEFSGGGLSGGGETIQLIAADGVTVVDEVAYDDASPWPGAPDGNGPSLELIDPFLDNANAANWLASDPGPTPAAQNTAAIGDPAGSISDIVVGPALPNQAFNVTATIADATEATLTFKVMFGEDQTVAMTNTGGDVWQATIPGQGAGALVRYRIDSDVAMAPFANDTINYLGVVVEPTDIVDNTLPVFQWFVDPDEFDTLINENFLTNEKISAVVAYGDQVIDNAEVRVRGNFSRNFPKKGFKFELPKGYLLDFGDLAATPVDEFGIVSDFGDWTFASAQISWEIFNAETESQTSSFFTRVEQNGDFYGVYRFQELYDGTWRTANGYDDGEFFQAEAGSWSRDDGFDQKEPDEENFANLFAARDILQSPPSAEKTQWLYDNVDIPASINHMALSAMMRHGDQNYHNFYVARDGSTGRWSLVEWDLDLTWRDVYTGIPGYQDDFTTPLPVESIFMDSIWEVPEFQEMYWQRLQTLLDTYLADDSLVDRRNEILDSIGVTNSDLEFAAWGRSDIVESTFFSNDWQNTIDKRQAIFAAETRLPGGSLDDPNIVINELHYNPAGTDAEFLELYNASSQAVDLSFWTIDGIGLTIAPGTVIGAGQYLVFSDADSQLRSILDDNVFIAGEYSGGLSGGGETITLSDQLGNIVDQVSYDDVAPWPTTPDGEGFTLALNSPEQDNADASNWSASDQANGTPGRNNFDEPPVQVVRVFAAGLSTDEILELEINGVVAGRYTVGGNPGDYASGIFGEWTFNVDQPLAGQQVRVNFVNDRYEPENDINYNLRVDRIEIDDQVYQTEDSTVFSTGVWVSGVGFVPGFQQTEILSGNGYFEYLV